MKAKILRRYIFVVGLLGVLGTLGCNLSIQEAARAGVFDFVAGTVGETLSALLPVAAAVSGGAG